MAKKPENKNFVKTVDGLTETYSIMFDYGTRNIFVRKNSKIVLNFVHGGFRNVFSRKGNDLIIGDNMYFCMAEPMGVGHGKEVWSLSLNADGTYNVEIKKFCWQGSRIGYSDTPFSSETKTFTETELTEFIEEFGLTLTEGENTLYTTWPVIPDPKIRYHMNDCAYYAPANGKLILKNYFLYKNNDIYVGDKLLSEIISESGNFDLVQRITGKNAFMIFDSFLSESIQGSKYGELIYSNKGDDTITPGKGNDRIFIGEGNKTVIIAEGDGKDTIVSRNTDNSLTISLDTDDISYTKSGNNLIINKKYGYKTEQTVLYNFFNNSKMYNSVTVKSNDTIISENLLNDLISGNKRITYTDNQCRGSVLSDEMYSSWKDETFITGNGNDIIHFFPDTLNNYRFYSLFGDDKVKISENSHITLDFDNNMENFKLSYHKDGADAVIIASREVKFSRYFWGNIIYDIQSVDNDEYKVNATQYDVVNGNCQTFGETSEEIWSASQYEAFKQGYNVNSMEIFPIIGYPVPDPIIIEPPYFREYSFRIYIGSVTLKDYFKYNNETVYIGDTSLQDILRNIENIAVIDESWSCTSQRITDTFLSDTIRGSRFADNITSSYSDDNITAGRGNDVITLGEGHKILNIGKGDGQDVINILKNNNSTDIIYDSGVQKLSLSRYCNNLIITRKYTDKTEKTVISQYFKNNSENSLTIQVGDDIVWNNKDNSPSGIIFEYTAQADLNAVNQTLCTWQCTDYDPDFLLSPDYSDQNIVLALEN